MGYFKLQRKIWYIIADGCLQEWDSYDCKIYTYGMGPTATTVTAPNVGVTTATPITITGTAMDISAGSKQEGVIENFPNGLPAVSDASMTNWMEYVYRQQPFPKNTTGVQVTLTVFDANNNTRTIGTTTTDTNGFYSLSWTPDIPGKYTVYATFGGTQSYWPSEATSAFTARSAAATTTEAPVQNTSQSTADQYFVPAITGLVVAIIIGFVLLALLILRKRA